MKGKKIFIAAGVVVIFLFAFVRVGVWNSRGGFTEFIKGQSAPSLVLDRRDVSLHPGAHPASVVRVRIDGARPVNTVDPEFISFAIDSSQLVGGKWWNPKADRVEMGGGEKHAPVFDFNSPKMDTLARGLAPAYLRIGGTEADKVYYAMDDDGRERTAPPARYESLMNRKQWDEALAFSARNGLRFVFTLNTGPSSRRPDGSWDGENAESLLAYAAKRGQRVDIWELGNELNLFWYAYGPSKRVSAEQYEKDLASLHALVKKYHPASRCTGQGSAVWPVLGEPLGIIFGTMEPFLARAGALFDVVSWHYYPQQSRRGPVGSRRAYPARLLDPDYLDEAGHWATRITKLRDAYAPGKPVWLGETGNAQYGGEPGVSDVYISGLWWMDELGLLARSGHAVVVRQTLSGSNYGMIDQETLAPRPDYWNSLLWKRLMGRKSFAVQVEGEGASRVRVYAHDSPGGGTCALVINLNHDRDASVSFPSMKDRRAVVYRLSAPDILGPVLLLNGAPLTVSGDGALPALNGEEISMKGEAVLTVRPISYTFIRFP
jgi:heparanase